MIEPRQKKLISARARIALVLAGFAVITAGGWWQYAQHQKTAEEKNQAERERIAKVFRDAGIASQKSIQLNGRPIQDPLEADPSISDQEELAQIKRWQNLPKQQRDAMREDAANAGIPATTLVQ